MKRLGLVGGVLFVCLGILACGDKNPIAPTSAVSPGDTTGAAIAAPPNAPPPNAPPASGSLAGLVPSAARSFAALAPRTMNALPTDGAPSVVVLPGHIQRPVEFPMEQGIVSFPPRNEPNSFFTALQQLYRDVLRRPQTAPSYVDPEGENVWLTEYYRFYLNGCEHVDAASRTIQEITSGMTLPTCGAERLAFPPRNLPNAFQQQLEATYRDVLRRPLLVSYVDTEGANVWLSQYLGFRVRGQCTHAVAQQKVFTEIQGGGVQPDCGAPYSRSGTGDTVFDMPSGITRLRIRGIYTGSSQNFIVYVGGRLIVNDILGTYRGRTTFDGTYIITGTVVEIRSSSGVSWTIDEVRQ